MMTNCCDEPEEPVATPPSEVEPPIPELANIEMNLDVILTHIMHEVHPDPDDLDLPEPNTPEEQTMITEVIEPVVIQLINNDIAPAMPTCTLPGQQGSASLGEDDDEEEAVDTGAVIGEMIESEL